MRLANDVSLKVPNGILIVIILVLSQELPLSGLIIPVEFVCRVKVLKTILRRFWRKTRGSLFFEGLLEGV